MKAFSKKTNEEIYLEYVNDFLTVEAMADNYNMDKNKLSDLIDIGRDEHFNKPDKLGDLLKAKDNSGTFRITKFTNVGIDGIIVETNNEASISHHQRSDWYRI